MDEKVLLNLLDIVKKDLQIPFADDDDKLENIILNGANKLSDVCGVVDDDFNTGGRANALLLAYCRRAYDGDLSTFDDDYVRDIMFLKNRKEVDYYAETEAESI